MKDIYINMNTSCVNSTKVSSRTHKHTQECAQEPQQTCHLDEDVFRGDVWLQLNQHCSVFSQPVDSTRFALRPLPLIELIKNVSFRV